MGKAEGRAERGRGAENGKGRGCDRVRAEGVLEDDNFSVQPNVVCDEGNGRDDMSEVRGAGREQMTTDCRLVRSEAGEDSGEQREVVAVVVEWV